MTLTASTAHNERHIDSLIIRATVNCFDNFEDIFLYVSRNYSLSNSQGFFLVVEKRFKSLKRRGVITYDRSTRAWIKSETDQ
jgi:hypothetical protein